MEIIMSTDDQPFASLLAISYYHKIADLSQEHGVSLTQHIETGEICVRKDMSVYNRAVYEQLQANPITGIPHIYHLHEDEEKKILTVIEEYISGTTLDRWLTEKGAMTESEAVECCVQLCDILVQLHESEPPIVHRDIKPSNIIRREDGSYVLIDLNAARQCASKNSEKKTGEKWTGAKKAGVKKTGVKKSAGNAASENLSESSYKDTSKERDTRLLGTAGYAAPEQYGFGESSPRSDIYAMGKLLETLLQSNEKAPSRKMQRIIKRCTRIKPEERYAAVGDLQRALRQTERKLPHRKYQKWTRPAAVGIAIAIMITAAAGTAISARKSDAAEIETDPDISTAATNDSSKLTSSKEEAGKASEIAEDNDADYVLSGTYEGENEDYLVFNTDGTVDYYCGEYTELNIPFALAEGTLSFYLPKLHCTIQTRTEGVQSPEELVFTSAHPAWEEEMFRRCESLSPLIIRRVKKTYDEKATLQDDGALMYELGGLQFVLPRQYIDNEDDGDSNDSYSVFFSADAGTGAYAFLLFSKWENAGKAESQEDLRQLAEQIAGRFYDGLTVEEKADDGSTAYTVAGMPAYQYRFSGKMKNTFGGLRNDPTGGEITLIHQKESGQVLAVMLSVYAGDGEEKEEEFTDYRIMLQNAVETSH